LFHGLWLPSVTVFFEPVSIGYFLSEFEIHITAHGGG
jgi:hypothetical protein